VHGSHFFWLGDLNYRITMPDAEVKTQARAGIYPKLLAADQVPRYLFSFFVPPVWLKVAL
jgi:hypothetical protein